MRRSILRLTLLSAAIFCAAAALAPVHAQEFPSKPIKIINGPSPDTLPRLFADKLNKAWGAAVVVEPRPGAGGEIAAKTVATADPDGHTLLFATSSFTLNTALQLAGYDFVKDFSPIAIVAVYPFVLIVNKDVPANSVEELVALARAKPGELNCGSAGQGTAPHLACELFNRIAGVKTVHVPFREANASMNALLGNHVQMSFAVSTTARAQIQGGTVRALGLTSARSRSLFPGLPTLDEAGLKGFDLRGWGGLVAPAGPPAPVLGKLNAAIAEQARAADVQASLERLGAESPPPYTLAETATFIADDIAGWNKIIDAGGVTRGRPN